MTYILDQYMFYMNTTLNYKKLDFRLLNIWSNYNRKIYWNKRKNPINLCFPRDDVRSHISEDIKSLYFYFSKYLIESESERSSFIWLWICKRYCFAQLGYKDGNGWITLGRQEGKGKTREGKGREQTAERMVESHDGVHEGHLGIRI